MKRYGIHAGESSGKAKSMEKMKKIWSVYIRKDSGEVKSLEGVESDGIRAGKSSGKAKSIGRMKTR